MKSKTFQGNARPGDDLLEDLKVILKAEEADLDIIKEWINTSPYFVRSYSESKKEISNLTKKTKLTGYEVTSIISASRNLMFLCEREKDDIEKIIEDVAEFAEIEGKDLYTLKTFLTSVYDKAKLLYSQFIQRRHETRGLPYFVDSNYVIDLRYVTDNPFSMYDLIEEYEPKLHSLIAVAILSFVASDGQRKNSFSMQLDFDTLEALINNLLAAQKEMRLLQEINTSITQQLNIETPEI